MKRKLLKLLDEKPTSKTFEKIRRDAYSAGNDIDEDTLTIGCELEFLLCVHKPNNELHTADWAKRQVITALKQPRTEKCVVCGNSFQHHLEVKGVHQGDNYEVWQVTQDATVGGQYPGGYEMFPIEVKSRVLNYHPPQKGASNCTHQPSYIHEIESAIERINTWFDGTVNNYDRMNACVLTNHSCGMHVHAGNGKGRPIPFKVVKRVLAFSVEIEKIIEELHSVDRIGGTWIMTQDLVKNLDSTVYKEQRSKDNDNKDLFNQPLSTCFLERAHRSRWTQLKFGEETHDTIQEQGVAELKCTYDTKNWAAWLEGVHDIGTLLTELFGEHARKCAINVSECPSKNDDDDKISRKKLTIEFRQHTGCLIPTLASSFVNLLTNVVLRCAEIDSEVAFYDMLQKRIPLPAQKFGLVTLCKALECDDKTVKTYDALRRGQETPVSEMRNREYSLSRKTGNEEKAFWARLPLRDALDHLHETALNPKKIDVAIENKLRYGGYGQYEIGDLQNLFNTKNAGNLHPHLVKGWRSEVKDDLLQARAQAEGPTPTANLESVLGAHASAPFHQGSEPVAGSSRPLRNIQFQSQNEPHGAGSGTQSQSRVPLDRHSSSKPRTNKKTKKGDHDSGHNEAALCIKNRETPRKVDRNSRHDEQTSSPTGDRELRNNQMQRRNRSLDRVDAIAAARHTISDGKRQPRNVSSRQARDSENEAHISGHEDHQRMNVSREQRRRAPGPSRLEEHNVIRGRRTHRHR